MAARRMASRLAARGATPSAFERRCIPPPPQRGCRVGDPGPGGVAPPSNTPGILGRRALPAGRIAALGATMDLHHGLLSKRFIQLHPSPKTVCESLPLPPRYGAFTWRWLLQI